MAQRRARSVGAVLAVTRGGPQRVLGLVHPRLVVAGGTARRLVRVVDALLALDAAAVAAVNAAARRRPATGRLIAVSAGWMAGVQVVLMLVVGASGRPRAIGRMLLSVGTVYVAVEALGVAWQRGRPFAQVEAVRPVVPHAAERSFPSRHVASAVAMARVGSHARPALGRLMAVVAGLLAIGRVGAGLHYPSDALAGAALGLLVGRIFRDRP